MTMCLGMILFISTCQLCLFMYLAEAGYQVFTSNSETLNAIAQVPIIDMADYMTTTFRNVQTKSPVDETIANFHETSKQLKRMVNDQEQTSRNAIEMSNEAVKHKAIFSETLRLALQLQTPLKELQKLMGPHNQADISVILDKVRYSLEVTTGSQELPKLLTAVTGLSQKLDKVLSKTNMDKMITFVTDSDDAIKRVESSMDKLHKIANAL
jgi:hypothetical protein